MVVMVVMVMVEMVVHSDITCVQLSVVQSWATSCPTGNMSPW